MLGDGKCHEKRREWCFSVGSPKRRPKDESFGAISSFWRAQVREKRNRDRGGMKASELSVCQWVVSRWLLYQAGSSLMLEALWEFMWRTSQDCSAEGWEIWITSPPPWSFLGWGLPFRELNPQPSEVPLAGLASFSGRGTPKSSLQSRLWQSPAKELFYSSMKTCIRGEW